MAKFVATFSLFSLSDTNLTGLLYHWKKQYARGKFNNEPAQEAAMLDRINALEKKVRKLTLENEFLKKALQNTLKEQERKESSLPLFNPFSKVSGGGVSS